jgi:hypothetical protein
MPDNSSRPATLPSDAPIPAQAGLGWAAMVLGAVCIPVAAYLGVQCLAVSLPVFGIWFFLPVVVLAIVLGMVAARTPQGVAGAALGVGALVVCLSFVLVDRIYGPSIREQIKNASAPTPAALKLDQLLKLTGNVPGGQQRPATQPR